MLINIYEIMELLQKKRKAFVSEADFQLELAWIIKDYLIRNNMLSSTVRCEYTPKFDSKMHIDILVTINGKWIPIELKYKTKACRFNIDGEDYVLATHDAKPQACYDYFKDVQRIEYIKANTTNEFAEGYTIFLTNEDSYRSKSNRMVTFNEFSIHEGAVRTGNLLWSASTSDNTKKGREKPIELYGKYTCNWHTFSTVDNLKAGEFFYIVHTINGDK